MGLIPSHGEGLLIKISLLCQFYFKIDLTCDDGKYILMRGIAIFWHSVSVR